MPTPFHPLPARSLVLKAALALGAIQAAASPAVSAPASPPRDRPNLLVIVADDLGFSDLGVFGGEIDTPNLDALARRGLRLTGFHSAPTCSPTRSMLMSGTDHHLAGLANMAEMISPNQRGKPGYDGYLSPKVASLPERLSAGGYRTVMAGKWHLGLKPDQDPHARGFQQSFALLQGGHNHFGQGLSPDPAKGSTYTENGRPVDRLPADFYSSDSFTTKLLELLGRGAGRDSPFFAYLCFTAPHWPLQAPAADIAKYRGKYDAGFEVLRKTRLKRQGELGLIDPTKPIRDPVLRAGGWARLTQVQQAEQIRLMEIYAAMVDRLDRNVGRVVEYLKASGQYENTVFLFLSDNGAEGVEAREGIIPSFKRRAEAADNRLENLGTATSALAYGPGWAQAATAPSRLYKSYTTDGGTRVPAFITYPRLARQNGISPVFGTVADVLPTLLELAGLPPATSHFSGRVVEPVRGTSWVPFLAGKTARVHAPTASFGWELFGHRALRQGDWKIVSLPHQPWELFNLADDPGETADLALAEPARLKDLIAAWDDYARQVGVVMPDETYVP